MRAARLLRPALLAACTALACSDPPPAKRTGEGLFTNGCPEPGKAFARVLTSDQERPTGPDALAAPGDLMLASTKAAFVVTKPGEPRTYYYYGGILADAVAVNDCRQASPERFGEIAPLAGRLDTTNFPASVLRGFRGDSAEIVQDGHDGKPAIVRVHGSDQLFWLVEMELQRRAWEGGTAKHTSEPLGVQFDVDYVLDPDSAVLQVVQRFTNTRDTEQTLLAGAALFLGDTTPANAPAFFQHRLGIGGFDLGYGTPWLAAGEGDGSYAVALETESFGTTNIAGVAAMVDLSQALDKPIRLAPKGQPGAVHEVKMFVAAGATDRNSATRELAKYHPNTHDSQLIPISGHVRETAGTPLPNVPVAIERQADDGTWAVLDELRTRDDGSFSGALADEGDGKPWRLRPHLTGRTPPEPRLLTLPDEAATPLDFTMTAAGGLGYVITDGTGEKLPAKLTLFRTENGHEFQAQQLFTIDGRGEAKVEPGDYRIAITRGYEYEPVEAKITVVSGESAPLEAKLERVVDTSGFLSMDGHVHQAPSMDSTVPVANRMDTVAAEGLEVMVATDHEIIEDLAHAPDATRLSKWMQVLNGEEVTATSPEHTNMWDVPARPDLVRGGPVRWYARDFKHIYAAERERGARIVTLNHPRESDGCSWLCQIDWDRRTGEPRVTDPTLFSLPADAELWSWDFDAVELLNGMNDIFLRENARKTGKFDDWMAFHNLGHHIAGVGVTDTHDPDGLGAPRTFFAAPTDDPAQFRPEMLERAVKQEQIVVSAGAFARLTVGGRGLGELATATGGHVDAHLHVEAVRRVDVRKVKLFVNCDEALELDATDPHEVVKLDTTVALPIAQDAYVVAVGFGDEPMPDGFVPVSRATPRFVTNPIYVDADGDGAFTAPGGKDCHYTAPR